MKKQKERVVLGWRNPLKRFSWKEHSNFISIFVLSPQLVWFAWEERVVVRWRSFSAWLDSLSKLGLFSWKKDRTTILETLPIQNFSTLVRSKVTLRKKWKTSPFWPPISSFSTKLGCNCRGYRSASIAVCLEDAFSAHI